MALAPIAFGNQLAAGHERLAGAMPSALNVCVDGTGTVRRRPGIQAHPTFPASAIAGAVDGMHVTPLGQRFASVDSGAGQRHMYALPPSGAAVFLGALGGVERAVFADTEALVVIASGGFVSKYPLGTSSSLVLGGSPPALVSHVVFNAGRLLVNDLGVDRSKVNYSSPAAGNVITGHEEWGGTGISGFFSAEARPDPIVALGENTNEVFVWGSTNLEVWAPSGIPAFSRVATRDYGCVAPYSVTRYDDAFVWVDHRRRLVRSEGRSVQSLSEAMGPVWDGFSRADDAFAYRLHEGPVDAMVVTFPSAGATYALQAGGGWSQWTGFEGGQPRPFLVTSHAHDPVTDTNFVGLSDGRVGQLVDGAADDLGEPIVASVESGYQDHGTSKRKVNQRVRFMLRRGEVAPNTAEPVAWVDWEDRSGAWSSKRPLYLGSSGENHPVVTLHSAGAYRQRNWRFTFSAGVDLALVRAEEEFEVVEE